ncbi:MAG: shikimate dehydrogenase [Clostridiales bacterium GWB2_37_7]|nr:MAG: shikimate dehydrogenase [Clostridiales bacterium GWB2_37_7]
MKVFGLIGEKLSHSLSPIIHKHIYELINLDATYSLFQVRPDELNAAAQGIRALGLQGVNVTIPYKVKIMKYLDDISPEAKKIGAVNTILHVGSYLTGYNTDYIGFGRMLDKYNIELPGKTAVVLGSGGAAKSVTTYLEDMGIAKVYIVTRNLSNISHFTKHEFISYAQLSQSPQFDLLINCTPVGMYPSTDASPINNAEVTKFKTIIDLIYNPSCTLLMRQANDFGVPAYNGLYMLVAQAVAAVEIWNNIKVSDDIVAVVYDRIRQHIKR